MQATFCKLKNGMWGVKVETGPGGRVEPGTRLLVTKRDGTTKEVTVSAVQVEKPLGVWTCEIVETKPAYGGGRPYYRGRPRGEQASLASQMAAYELAEPKPAPRWEVSGGTLRSEPRPEDPVVVMAPFTVPSADEDPAETFKRLLAGEYTPGESSVRDAGVRS